MGFWHTGYMEFHEPLDIEGQYQPVHTIYRCQHCPTTFNDPEALRAHRFETHPYFRPVLLIGGFEVGTTPFTIARHISSNEIITSQSEAVWLNGLPLPSEQLGKRLAQINNDTVRIKLANEGVDAEFILKFEIASQRDIQGVDQCFLATAQGKRLDKHSISQFIAAAKAYPTASRYLDGVCLYFYGVLAKEKSPESSIRHDEYLEYFNRAADELKDFDTPIARTIGALIGFHFNHFKEASEMAKDSRVGIVSNRFVAWLSGSRDRVSADSRLQPPSNLYLESTLTDADSERLLVWTIAKPADFQEFRTDIEATLKTDISEYDRAKMCILLAESYAESNNIAAARHHAKGLRNSASLSDWADHFLERLC